MIADLSRLPDDSESAFVRCDCMDLMARYPDGYFNLAIVDPPYGINMGHACGVGRGGYKSHSAVGNRTISVYGDSTKALAKQNFITRSMIARHRTKDILKSYSEYQKRKLYSVVISS